MTAIEVSPVLKSLVDQLADAVGKTAELVERIKSQAEAEGLSLQDTRELIVSALKKRQLSDRQTTRILTEYELTDKEHSKRVSEGMVRKNNQSDKMSVQSENTTDYGSQEPTPIPNVIIRPAPKSSDEITIPQDKPTITEAQIINEQEYVLDVKRWFAKVFAANRNGVNCIVVVRDGQIISVEAENERRGSSTC